MSRIDRSLMDKIRVGLALGESSGGIMKIELEVIMFCGVIWSGEVLNKILEGGISNLIDGLIKHEGVTMNGR
jgi:hypothetical protein